MDARLSSRFVHLLSVGRAFQAEPSLTRERIAQTKTKSLSIYFYYYYYYFSSICISEFFVWQRFAAINNAIRRPGNWHGTRHFVNFFFTYYILLIRKFDPIFCGGVQLPPKLWVRNLATDYASCARA